MSVPSAQRKKTEWDVSKKHFMHTKIVWKYKNKRWAVSCPLGNEIKESKWEIMKCQGLRTNILCTSSWDYILKAIQLQNPGVNWRHEFKTIIIMSKNGLRQTNRPLGLREQHIKWPESWILYCVHSWYLLCDLRCHLNSGKVPKEWKLPM